MPVYKPDVLRDIADTQRSQAGQFTSAQSRAPLTTATAGWKLPDRSAPDTPESGAHIYANAGELWVKQADGTSFVVEPAPEVPFTQGSAVTSPPLFESPSAPDAVTVEIYKTLRDDAQAVRGVLITLLQSLRAAGIIAS